MGLLYSAISDFSQNEGCRETGIDCHDCKDDREPGWAPALSRLVPKAALMPSWAPSSDSAGQCHAGRGRSRVIDALVGQSGLVEGIFDCVFKKASSADAAEMAQPALAGPGNGLLLLNCDIEGASQPGYRLFQN
jgi:hypothetical protein